MLLIHMVISKNTEIATKMCIRPPLRLSTTRLKQVLILWLIGE